MGTPKPKRGRKGRAPRGQGSVFFSEGNDCWMWRAATGRKPDGSLSYTTGRARTQAAAVAKKQAAEKAGTRPHADRETVGEYLDYWLNDIAKPNTRGNTWDRYESVVRLHLKPNVGGTPLRKLTVSQVTKLWADLGRDGPDRKALSTGTVKKCSEVLATALEAAVAEERIAVAPTANAAKPNVIQGEVEVFTDEEVKKIIAAAAGHKLESLILLGVGTGAREGELFALDAADFDRAAATVRIVKMLDQRKGQDFIQPTKSKAGIRTIGLPRFALVALEKHLAGRTPGPAFTTATGGYLSKTNFIRRDWAGLLKKAGVKYRKFHTLRHTHASRLLADGVDPAEVARRIGDRIETVMRTYAHWIPTAGRDTPGRVDRIYGGEL